MPVGCGCRVFSFFSSSSNSPVAVKSKKFQTEIFMQWNVHAIKMQNKFYFWKLQEGEQSCIIALDALFKCPQSTHRSQQNTVSEFSIIWKSYKKRVKYFIIIFFIRDAALCLGILLVSSLNIKIFSVFFMHYRCNLRLSLLLYDLLAYVHLQLC